MHCVFTPGVVPQAFFLRGGVADGFLRMSRHAWRLYNKKIQNGSDFSVLCNFARRHGRWPLVFLTFPANNFVFFVRL